MCIFVTLSILETKVHFVGVCVYGHSLTAHCNIGETFFVIITSEKYRFAHHMHLFSRMQLLVRLFIGRPPAKSKRFGLPKKDIPPLANK